MSAFVRKYPTISFLVLVMILGTILSLGVAAGLLPPAASQLGAISSSLAAIVLVVVEGRKGGLRELLGRVLVWRVGVWWWAFALFFPIIPTVAALYLFSLLGGPPVDWSGLQPVYTIIPWFLLFTIAAGIGEEFGWRGFLLPRLQPRHNALVSSLIVGVIWAGWHVPQFFIKGTPQYNMQSQDGLLLAVIGFVTLVIVSSIQFTWVFNNTRGSVLLAAVMHGANNAWGGYIGVYRGHIGGAITFAGLSALISIIIVLAAGPANLSSTNQKNVLELVPGQPITPQIPKGGVVQPAETP